VRTVGGFWPVLLHFMGKSFILFCQVEQSLPGLLNLTNWRLVGGHHVTGGEVASAPPVPEDGLG
jgi:hypothetical protein